MQLMLTALRADTDEPPAEIEVSAPEGTTAAELARALARELGSQESALRIGGDNVPSSALVGLPPLVHGAAVCLGSRAGERASPSAALELQVVGGPDAGRRHPLTGGTHRLGRSSTAEIPVEDPGLSRQHAVVTVTPSGVSVRDARSTNGLLIDGAPVPEEGAPFAPGQTLVAGDSRFRLRGPSVRPASTATAGDGFLSVNRAPRVRPSRETPAITLPTPPEPRRSLRIPWVAMILPLPLCAVLAVFYGPQMLMFGLMSPLLMAANAVGDRVSGRREYAQGLAEFERLASAAQERIAAGLAQERAHRFADYPDAAEILQIAARPGSRLWERRRGDEDMLAFRLGTGTMPSVLKVIDPARGHGSHSPSLSEAPVCARFAQIGVLGIAGPPDQVLATARCVAGQLATLHSPRDLALWVLGDAALPIPDIRSLGRLPHTAHMAWLEEDRDAVIAAVEALQDEIAARQASSAQSGLSGTWHGHRIAVLLVGSHRLREIPGLSGVLEDGPSVGIVTVALGSKPSDLPVECRSVMQIGPGSSRLEVAGSPALPDFTADGTSTWWLERISRGLAPLRDATPAEADAALPEQVALRDLLDFDPFSAEDIARQWNSQDATTVAVVGASLQGAFAIDLASDGPHVLVGGTTGSGKSEFLQTLVTSLALGNRPEELALVLVDYKGGSAFSACARLPHTVGLVTDLDGHLTERALVSLRAELTRRERLLSEVGARDLDDYHRLRRAGQPRLPRLVLVIDEFRAMADDLPDFMDGLVRLAAVGRSLGVHVVLATQRPAGIVSSDIKANVNLRIALRVRDRADSDDVIEAPDAAAISERTRGRAIARGGSAPMVPFQGARVSGHSHRAGEEVLLVRTVNGGPPTSSLPAADSAEHGPSDLERMVDAIRAAVERVGAGAPRAPWLPALPESLAADFLPAVAPDTWDVPWGLADVPQQQDQPVFTWNPLRESHIAIAGTSGTGRTSALRTLAVQVASRLDPSLLHLYAVDGAAGGLSPLAALTHTGSVVAREDLARLRQLVGRLGREIASRQRVLADAGFASVSEWHGSTGTAAGTPPPFLLLLIDDLDLLARESDQQDHGALTDQLLALIREGEPAGVRVVVAGDRSVLIGRLASCISTRLVLRLADPSEAAMAGLTRSSLPEQQPPGRAVMVCGSLAAGGATEIQLAHLGGDPSGPTQTAAVAARADALPALAELDAGSRPFRVSALPTRVEAETLALTPTPDRLPFAVGGDEGDTRVIDLARDGRQVLVAGPPRSGKSTTLVTLAQSALRAGRSVAVVTARGAGLPGLGLPGVLAQLGPDDRDLLIQVRRADPDLVVVVDDADQLLDTPVEEVLREIARLTDRDGGAVICAASTLSLGSQFRGLAIDVARHQTGVLLCPQSVSDGDVFGIRVDRGAARLPGRGLLVSRGKTTPVQVALPSQSAVQHLQGDVSQAPAPASR